MKKVDFDFNKALDIVKGVAETTKKKVAEEYKVVTLSYDKGTAESDLECAYADLGKIAFKKIKEEGLDLGSEAKSLVEEIENIKNEIDGLKGKISAHKIERDTAEYNFAPKDETIEVEIKEEEKSAE